MARAENFVERLWLADCRR